MIAEYLGIMDGISTCDPSINNTETENNEGSNEERQKWPECCILRALSTFVAFCQSILKRTCDTVVASVTSLTGL